MNLTNSPNLKPYRDYDEHDVINGLFSANVATLNKGSFVSIVAGASGNTNVSYSGNRPATPLLGIASSYGNGPSRVTSFRTEVKWKVKAAASGEVPLGITLYDVRDTNAYGESYLARNEQERIEQECVLSGQAVPILTKGLVTIKGFIGTPGPGSGITNAISGSGVVGAYVKGTSFGRFLSAPDFDGFAIFKLEL